MYINAFYTQCYVCIITGDSVMTIEATDVDEGVNADVTYTLYSTPNDEDGSECPLVLQ